MTLMHHVSGRVLWLVAGGLVALLFLTGRGGDTEDPTSWQHQVQTLAAYRWTVRGLTGQVLATEAGTKRITQALRLTIARRDSAIAFLQEAEHTIVPGPAGRDLRVLAARCTDAITESQYVNTLCQQRGDSLARQDSLHQALYQLAASRSAKADSIIAQGLKATQCKFLLFLPCLSRAHALELGLVAGVVGTLVVRR